MKECYEAAGVRTARFREIPTDTPDEEIASLIEGLEFPLIFKAVDTSGSRGIMRVDSPEEFPAARANVLRYTHDKHYLIEEFIEGEEFGAQAFIEDGELQFILPHGDYVFHGDTGVPVGHFAPYDISEAETEDAKLQLTLAAKAMGLDNCAINADFIMKDGKTYVLELGGRSGATCLAELVSIYYGFDYYEKMIRVAMGEKVSFESDKAVPNASKLLISDRTGVITAIRNDNVTGGDLCDVHFDYEVGEHVNAFHVGPDRIGHVITKGETLEEAVRVLDEAMDRIHIEIGPEAHQ
jgi:biotin carboxylase